MASLSVDFDEGHINSIFEQLTEQLVVGHITLLICHSSIKGLSRFFRVIILGKFWILFTCLLVLNS